MKKITSAFLVITLVILIAPVLAKERRGAELLIQKVDGQQIKGELITVKENTLLLLSPIGSDLSVCIDDVIYIKIVKKSKFMSGAIRGLPIGLGVGLVMGVMGGVSLWGESDTSDHTEIFFGSLLGGGIYGFLVGGGIGALSKDKTFQIKGKSDSEIKEILEKLRTKARISNYN